MARIQPLSKAPDENRREFTPPPQSRTLGGKLFACVWREDNDFLFWDSSSPSNQSLIVL